MTRTPDLDEAPMRLPTALLEHWMRQYYFRCDIDIGSSGVEDYSFAELRELLGIDLAQLDRLVFHDSETLGGAGLRQAIADRHAGGDSRRVMATHGASEANFMLMHALLLPGDEVVVLDPCYPQLQAIAAGIGCRLRRWPLRFEQGYRADLDLARRLITEKTRMVVVNFPQNPTGATLTRDEQSELLEIAAQSGAWLVWDGAFSELTYDSAPLPDPNLLYERAVSMGTLSKAYGLPGLRVGWCLAPDEVLTRMVQVRDYLTLHLSPLVEFLAQRAIEKTELLVGPRVRQARHNRELLASWVAGHADQVRWVPPQGGVTGFLHLPHVPDVDALCARLAEESRVLLVPGSCFGEPQHVRLGFGTGSANLLAGLDQLSSHLAAPLGTVDGPRLPYSPVTG